MASRKRATKSKAKSRKPARKTRPAARASGKTKQRPIEVYFWPTPNGRRRSDHAGGIGLPYVLKPVNIGRGDQFRPDF